MYADYCMIILQCNAACVCTAVCDRNIVQEHSKTLKFLFNAHRSPYLYTFFFNSLPTVLCIFVLFMFCVYFLYILFVSLFVWCMFCVSFMYIFVCVLCMFVYVSDYSSLICLLITSLTSLTSLCLYSMLVYILIYILYFIKYYTFIINYLLDI